MTRTEGAAPGLLWRNWSGSIRFFPGRYLTPDSEEEVCAILREAGSRGERVRVVASGHSSNRQLVCEQTVISTERLRGVVEVDRSTREAVVMAGTPLDTIGEALYDHDLALPNYGDIATQTVGGAISTGTHGTGVGQRNLSDMMVEAELVDGRGELRQIPRDDPQLLRAARVALGCLGVFTRYRLKLVPSFDVERREYAARTEDVLADLDRLVADNRSFDFYWYPRRDDIKLRMINAFHGGTPAPAYARLLRYNSGNGQQVIPIHSGIPHRFEESEYALPFEAGVACFRAVRRRILERWRHIVGWRVLWRTVAADEGDLSPASGRDTATISLHQNASLPWEAFFRDIEPVFRDHGGRPHWAKKHWLRAPELEPMYPGWSHFHKVRARFDPDGTFLTPYMRELLGVDA